MSERGIGTKMAFVYRIGKSGRGGGGGGWDGRSLRGIIILVGRNMCHFLGKLCSGGGI
jgi:hypothetical protein